MDLVRFRLWFVLLSILVIAAGVVAMAIPPAFRVGIEFAGGSAISLDFVRPVDQGELRQIFSDLGRSEAVLQRVGDTGFLVRTKTLEEAQRDPQGVIIKLSERELIENALTTEYGSGLEVLTLTFAEVVDEAALKAELAAAGRGDATVEKLGDRQYSLTTRPFQPAPAPSAEAAPTGQTSAEAKPAEGEASTVTAAQQAQPAQPLGEREALEKALSEKFSRITVSTIAPDRPWESFEVSSVSPSVAQETVRNAIIAVVVASLAILLYIWWAFRRVKGAFSMGAAAIVAAIHDVLITLGLFSILGKFMNAEINAMFISGMLTVVGYSVHDTIVVFDRIRENTIRAPSRDQAATINYSIAETMGRSLNTSLTTLIVIVSLLLLGGATIQSFLLTLLIGIVTGTYSSIFIAAQLLIIWRQREWLGPLTRRKPTQSMAAPAP